MPAITRPRHEFDGVKGYITVPMLPGATLANRPNGRFRLVRKDPVHQYAIFSNRPLLHRVTLSTLSVVDPQGLYIAIRDSSEDWLHREQLNLATTVHDALLGAGYTRCQDQLWLAEPAHYVFYTCKTPWQKIMSSPLTIVDLHGHHVAIRNDAKLWETQEQLSLRRTVLRLMGRHHYKMITDPRCLGDLTPGHYLFFEHLRSSAYCGGKEPYQVYRPLSDACLDSDYPSACMP